jgi:protein gp37
VNKTNIEYLTHSWNPLAMRCTPISAGCANCWHLQMANRLAKNPKLSAEERAAYAGEGLPVLKQRELEAPLKRKKPSVIGLQFMGDVGHGSIPELMVTRDIWNVMVDAEQHMFLVLTKRPSSLAELWEGHTPWPENIWPGVTVENQDTMWRIEEMFKIPAAHYWISFEPLLSAIDGDQLRHYLNGCPEPQGGGVQYVTHDMALDAQCPEMEGMPLYDEPEWVQTTPPIGGVVVGGESGPHARPMPIGAARDIRDACVEAGTPYTFKQHGKWLHESQLDGRIHADFVGMPEWTEELAALQVKMHQVRHQWSDGSVSYSFGKKGAGRLLDGKVWDEFPWDTLKGQSYEQTE